MYKSILLYCFLLLLTLTNVFVHGSCDIFFYNKCPLPPVTITVNIAEFCRDAKKHVDCVNRRLENCTEVQEYGPALETLKLTFKVYLTQATSHGCHNLYDLIRIPRRLPRTRRSTTKKPRRRKSKRRRTTVAVEYHCRKKLVVDSCGSWNESLSILNRTICGHAFHYIQCLSPLKMKCQNMLSNDEQILHIQAFIQKCFKKFIKSSKNHIDCLNSNFTFVFICLVTLFLNNN
ncbi:unnamed protein product [Rotaria socialis]|uniref:Uncharacterized protein n=1 Tax=Rotaria socialis TaxID=392032 RepID=A0A821ABU5_9BILA|nr:unnamed protein product [Rotaria socialis]CAF3593803.1 unnamed protein product [Rotaria socialis]CAF3735819.1 unnamed protein product [Rotaria socialis]CAF4474920.1 unnamed protein product [Rotaria socialis]CAF4574676.1 unnamed protein product [Rotaria socialis]